MKLAYKAWDQHGNVVVDSIDAADEREARERLRREGLFVTSVSVSPGAVESFADDAAATRRRPRISGRQRRLAMWSRQLSVLVRTGTPLAQAMHSIERQVPEGPWRSVLADLRRRVEEGQPLSEALAAHRNAFDDVTVSLTAAGESSGQLDAMLERISSITRQQLKTRRTVVGALVYPCLLVSIGVIVVLGMLIFVLPRFAKLFDSLGMPLPPVTEALMGLSAVIRDSWWLLLIGLVVAVAGAWFALVSSAGRRWTDRFLVTAPFVGRVARSLATARIARVLGVLLQSHVPLLESIELTRRASTNSQYAELMRAAEEAATRGESISGVFARSPLISGSVSEAMHHGERNGLVGPILTEMADFLDEENEVVVRTAMSVLEPLILVVLGVIVGFIALSLFVPLFDMTSMAGG